MSVGCDRLAPTRRAVLPSDVSVLAELHDGEPLSLLLGLRRNSRDQLDVRVAEGAQVYDGRRVWSIERGPDGLSALDRVTSGRSRFDVDAAARLLLVHQRQVWLQSPAGIVQCDLRNGACGETSEPPAPPLSHPGPGPGFHLALEHGTLRVALPQDRGSGIVLATGVARLLGVYWVRGGTGEADATVHRTFRGRARVHALARAVTPDGDLSDWPEAAPLVVEAPWHLQSGGEAWRGARDASFSVAATWTAERVCLAGRVRDEALGAGDVLTVQIDAVRRVLPLAEAVTGPDEALAPEWLGARWETCFPSAELPPRARLPLSVSYADADPGEATTVLASAPSVDGVPLGELLLDAPSG